MLKRFMRFKNIKSIKQGKKELRAYFEAVAEGAFNDDFDPLD